MKEKFDACGIGGREEKVFILMCSMDREGIERLIARLPKDKASLLLSMESTASYHIPLLTYLGAHNYGVVVINPLLINGFSKWSLRRDVAGFDADQEIIICRGKPNQKIEVFLNNG